MKKTIVALFALTYLSSCDYSTSSNGNIDAAFAREPIENTGTSSHHGEQKSESGHGHETESVSADALPSAWRPAPAARRPRTPSSRAGRPSLP